MTAPFLNPTRTGFLRLTVTALLALAAAQPALSANVTSSGNFSSDDNVQMLMLTLTGAGSITVTSIGYAGGTAFGGGTVAAGGFDTNMYLFSAATGLMVAQSDDGVGVPTDPVTGSAYDAAFTTASLSAGLYYLALTQYDNTPNSFSLSDGFSLAGTGNFTSAFGCSQAAFCDFDGNNRSSSWTVNFSGNTLASVVPEPGSIALVLAAGAALLASRRPKRASDAARRAEVIAA